ncbi:MAG TPA: hypothetical protein VHV57_10815, partial [Acidimicrobiales bacterium]|nr:hypothetical protein [Acidimicrobiales bacterium]
MAESAAVTEPSFLTARRERARELVNTLPLPSFKGRPGWEFTDISALDLSAYTGANGDAGVRDARAVLPFALRPDETAVSLDQWDGIDAPDHGKGVPEGVIVAPLTEAAASRPELVERHL